MGNRQFEPKRAVKVRKRTANYDSSGYRIGGRLVLTAAHIVTNVEGCDVRVEDEDGFVRVEDEDGFGTVEARVVWKDKNADIALVELPEHIDSVEAVVFGRLPEAKTGEKFKFDMYGYPKWAWTEKKGGEFEVGGRHIEGTIFRADSSPEKLLVLEPDRQPQEVQEVWVDSDSLWKGNSGAAIVCNGLVVAVQKQHQNPRRPASLEASPLSMVYSDEQWRHLLRQHDINPEPAIASQRTFLGNDKETERPKHEIHLLKRLREELQLGNNLITLNMQTQPDLVLRSQIGNVKINPRFNEDLPSETKIFSIFKQEKGKLLVLGEPGSGKSTVLLKLFQELLDVAEVNLAPIPVVFELSSWREELKIEDLMVERLKLIYKLPDKDAKLLVKEKRITPLLDGLDEVKSDRGLCVKAINQLLQGENSPDYLVVCSRKEEYEKVVLGRWEQEISEPQEERRLHLNNAILLQPLTREQIESYLISENQIDLWHTIQQNSELLHLVTIPLFLWVLCFLSPSGKFSLDVWRNLTSSESQRQYLFDSFWKEAVERDLVRPELLSNGVKSKTYGKRKIPTTAELERWLGWLAQELEQESKTSFLIEQLQPKCLEGGFQREGYFLIYSLFVTVVLASLPTLYVLGGSMGIATVILFVKVLLLARFVNSSKITVKQRPRLSIKALLLVGVKKYLQYALPIGVLIGISFGLTRGVIVALSSGLSVAITGGVIFYAKLTYTSAELEENVIQPNQGIKRLRDNTLAWTAIGFFLGVFWRLVLVLREWLSYMLIPGSTEEGMLMAVWFGLGWLPDPVTTADIGLLVGLLLGGLDCLKHLSLRCILCWSGNMPWNYAKFLDYCTERVFLQKVGGRYKFIHKLFQKYVAQHKGVNEMLPR